ncbi:hypothetical protein [Streptomyces sp. SM12]|uniref:hypothetical protein n=1 Tax=Streptomyces sp. SM12 TaxID=1071602 RepID=UPI000CD52B2F|nr:hypothetical protein [Streptomyces sp. SM12]
MDVKNTSATRTVQQTVSNVVLNPDDRAHLLAILDYQYRNGAMAHDEFACKLIDALNAPPTEAEEAVRRHGPFVPVSG